MLPRLRSSAHLLRKLRGVEATAAAAAARRLSGAASASSARETSLLRQLPGLDLPPCLPDQFGRSPTMVTTLPNGIRLASEDVPGPAACIGLFVDSGSIYETAETTGASHLLEKLAFKDTKHRSHLQIVQELEFAGGNVGASASREQTVYSCDTLKAYMPQAVEVLIDCVRNPLFLQEEVERQVALAREEVQDLQKNPERFLHEALNLAGYTGGLANPLIAPEHTLAKINDGIIRKFYQENFTADRLVLASSGVDHQNFLDLAEPLLNDWQKGSSVEKPKSTYVGGDYRQRAESDATHVALAFEVPGGWLQERDSTILTVLQTLLGGGGSFSSGGPGKGMHSQLYVGLFGIYLSTSSELIAKAVDIAISELIAVATPGEVTEVELTRAKNSTISSVLMNLESRAIVAEDIGRQLLTYGCSSAGASPRACSCSCFTSRAATASDSR